MKISHLRAILAVLFLSLIVWTAATLAQTGTNGDNAIGAPWINGFD